MVNWYLDAFANACEEVMCDDDDVVLILCVYSVGGWFVCVFIDEYVSEVIVG